MRSAFVIGNIASGKSTATRYLEGRGARRIDLDDLAKSLYVPGSDIVDELEAAFGSDVVDEGGYIVSAVLARHAFSSPEATRLLNSIVHPRLRQKLTDILFPVPCCSVSAPDYPLTLVEVSVPTAVQDLFNLVDDVIAIHAPRRIRRERAIARGMSGADFDARADAQPSDDELIAMASVVIDNTAGDDSLFVALDEWLARQGIGA